MAIVVIASDGGVLDGAVHSFNLPVRPGMIDFGEAMLDAIFPAPHSEHVSNETSSRTFGVARWETELDAVVGENRVDLVGNRRDERDEEG